MSLNDPVPSSATDVFFRNIEDIDKAVNEDGDVTTRTGKVLESLPSSIGRVSTAADAAEISIQDAIDAAVGAGLFPPVPYTSGISITSYQQTVIDNGVTYAYIGTLPATTPATFVPADWRTVSTASGAASELTAATEENQRTWSPKILARWIVQFFVRSVDTVADLRNLEPTVDGQQISLLGYTLAGIGGGDFYYDASDSVSSDNGWSIIVTPGNKRWKRSDISSATSSQLGLDSTTDSTAALNSFDGHSLTLEYESGGYELAGVDLSGKSVTGHNFVNIRSFNGLPLFSMRNNSSLSGVVIDGENTTSNRIELGSGGGDNCTIENSIILDCPINSIRTAEDSLGTVHIRANYADNSKLFNTNDLFNGKRLIIESNIATNVPSEGILIDQPGVTPDYTGAILSSNILEMSENASRGLGLARTVATVSNSNIYKGNTGVDDLLHLEDKAELHISSSEVFMGGGAGRIIDGSLGGDPLYTQTDRQPKSILINGDLIRADGVDAIWFQGTEPLEFANLTITNNHIEGCNIPISLRAKEGLVSGNVIYDPARSILSTKQSIDVANSSDDAHNVLVTNNHYIRPQFIRGNVGMCFDPNNIVFKTSFADEGAAITIGGAAGDSVISYPVDGDGVKYFRITGGAAATTRRIDMEWAVGDIDFQNLDAISIQLMTKYSSVDIGKVQVIFPNAGVGLAEYRINDTDNANWKVRGATKQAIGTDFYAPSAGLVQIRIWLGDNLENGETLDIAWIKVSAVSAY